MIKKNMPQIILTSAITLLPIVAGLILWNNLPEQIAVHFDINGNADGFASKGIAVFGFPILMLAVHAICIFSAESEFRKKSSQKKNLSVVMWTVPLISLLANAAIYSQAISKSFDVALLVFVLLGFLFIFAGNYMPKLTVNGVAGYRIRYTRENKENWYSTHRFAGKLWVIVGIVTVILAFTKVYVAIAVLSAVILVAPLIYSYIYHKKHSDG